MTDSNKNIYAMIFFTAGLGIGLLNGSSVVGGGDSAAEYCDILSSDNQITLSYRGTEFQKVNPLNRKIIEERISSAAVRALMPSQIQKIESDAGYPKVTFKEAQHGAEKFDLVLSDQEMRPMQTIGDILSLLRERGKIKS